MAREDYPEELFYEPPEWSKSMDLVPGSVIRLSHENTDIVLYFECTGPNGGNRTEGILTTMVNGEPDEGVEATINTLHPNAYLAEQSIRYVEFLMTEGDKKISIHPAYTAIDKAFDIQLARKAFADEKERLDREPFQNEGAQTTLVKLVSLFMELA